MLQQLRQRKLSPYMEDEPIMIRSSTKTDNEPADNLHKRSGKWREQTLAEIHEPDLLRA